MDDHRKRSINPPSSCFQNFTCLWRGHFTSFFFSSFSLSLCLSIYLSISPIFLFFPYTHEHSHVDPNARWINKRLANACGAAQSFARAFFSRLLKMRMRSNARARLPVKEIKLIRQMLALSLLLDITYISIFYLLRSFLSFCFIILYSLCNFVISCNTWISSFVIIADQESRTIPRWLPFTSLERRKLSKRLW